MLYKLDLAKIHNTKLPKIGHKLSLPTPTGSADSFMLAHWIKTATNNQKNEKGCNRIIVCDSQENAQRITEEVKFFIPEKNIGFFPDWETLPYEPFSPHQDLISDRLLCLYEAATGKLDAIVIGAESSMMRIAPPSFLAANTFFFEKKQIVSIENIRNQLKIAGYEPVNQVVSPGEYALRGNIVDIFPMGSELPFRVEFFDDEIETIRLFDPDTQRSIHQVNEIRILPSKEFLNNQTNADNFRSKWRDNFEGDPTKSTLYKDAGSGIFGAGIEYYMPFLHESTSSIFDYLADQSEVFIIGDVSGSLLKHYEELSTRFNFLKHDTERPVLKPSEISLANDEWFNLLKKHRVLLFNDTKGKSPACEVPLVKVNSKSRQPYNSLFNVLSSRIKKQQITIILAENKGRVSTVSATLAEHNIKLTTVNSWFEFEQTITRSLKSSNENKCFICPGPINKGFDLPFLNILVVTEQDLYNEHVRVNKRGIKREQTDVENLIRDLSELKIESPVVHLDHGVGRYQGLVHLNIGDGENEFLHLRYANDASLYVPVSQLHIINRYTGADKESAPMHSLGSDQWEKAKKKAAKLARDTAAELLNLYARRAMRVGYSFSLDSNDYEQFCQGFSFTETPDQLATIHAVVQDMISSKPMDRLVCGDVGFGKTEVALRAAFIAVMAGKQVAVLTPTTLLAEQHFQTFKDRFAELPVKIKELSRFRSQKEINISVKEIKNGLVDIVIGTHRLISKEIKFKDLGLLIIDEEHRFGVRQKEKFKELRSEVDILTLTATPIPRTLAMSMEGIRDFSVIATAPQKRLAIKTLVRFETEITVKEALHRELKRGGQAYVLHNEVKSIENRKELLQRIVPEARIGVAHGKMPERELERVMKQFTQKQFNILLCTTIIETGIDIPSANTIIIYRADKFGLAQLHQLRGRVGRSHHQAYAYLLTPEEANLSADALKRLDAIQSMEELGSGFFLALHDLEIRGAGEVLGDQQSGNISEIGFSLYADMLKQAVDSLKNGTEPDLEAPLKATIEINFHLPALLPKNYCPDVHERLTIYKRLANTKEPKQLEVLEGELIDRFGKIPPETAVLIEVHKFRQSASKIGIQKIDATNEFVVIQFDESPNLDPDKIIYLIQNDSRFKLLGPTKLKFLVESNDFKSRSKNINECLSLLISPRKLAA